MVMTTFFINVIKIIMMLVFLLLLGYASVYPNLLLQPRVPSWDPPGATPLWGASAHSLANQPMHA